MNESRVLSDKPNLMTSSFHLSLLFHPSIHYPWKVLTEMMGVNDFVRGLLCRLERPVPGSSTPAIAAENNLPFGFIETNVEALKPPPGVFFYDDIDYKIFDPERLHFPPILSPVPAATPPSHTSYPISPAWTLRKSFPASWWLVLLFRHLDISDS
ncbi:hypothetical protein K435DRAFT_871450 [Dendrothele bispora CBS 962.96]|uniref:Uncharacterized protein n=1 Tax=Dendrothele bispora (strain CBS 962.96) TaxID=1314807 RepID=A0A4S8L5F2_DENBC|nr:hypothetical protein K435DRAFT_871450 [Dendrothele bispora CBS 962.96]